MRILKHNQAASTAVRLYEKFTITSDYAGNTDSIQITLPNKEVYTPNGQSLELWLKRDGAAMRLFNFTELNSREIEIDRTAFELREDDELLFIEYYGYVDSDLLNTQKILDLRAEFELFKAEAMDLFIPLGFGYIQFANSPLPGDTLLDVDKNDITESDDFSDEDLNNCMYSGTTWKLAVREGDFLRQVGSRSNEDELEISSAAFGETQEDQFQGHRHNANSVTLFLEGDQRAAIRNASGSPGDRAILDPITDGTNGEPRVGVETRPVNTAVRFWVRVA